MNRQNRSRIVGALLASSVVGAAMLVSPVAASAAEGGFLGNAASATGLRVTLPLLGTHSLSATGTQTVSAKTATLLAVPAGLGVATPH